MQVPRYATKGKTMLLQILSIDVLMGLGILYGIHIDSMDSVISYAFLLLLWTPIAIKAIIESTTEKE